MPFAFPPESVFAFAGILMREPAPSPFPRFCTEQRGLDCVEAIMRVFEFDDQVGAEQNWIAEFFQQVLVGASERMASLHNDPAAFLALVEKALADTVPAPKSVPLPRRGAKTRQGDYVLDPTTPEWGVYSCGWT
jgi:hypothetical protein